MKNYFKIAQGPRLLLFVILSFLSINMYSQTTTHNYNNSSALFPNPERGWYDHTSSYGSDTSTNYSRLNASSLRSARINDNVTLIMRLFYIHEFVNQSSISASYISKMQSDFDAMRTAGVKCVLRFAYSSSTSTNDWDATPARVLSQIASLSDVLSNNSDVIFTVQAGFVGVWGEWYYTTNFAGPNYSPSTADNNNRRALVEALLDVFPSNKTVQLRTPAIKYSIVRTDTAITSDDAFGASYRSRLAHHNDCFLANATDYGTYGNITKDKAYLNQETKYLIQGGETCDPSNSYSDCNNALTTMEDQHWTYLNRDYNGAVIAKWISNGCKDDVDKKLGYRLRMVSSQIQDDVTPGSNVSITLNMHNDGYAAPMSARTIKIILTNTSTSEETALNFSGNNSDIRYWLPGESNTSGTIAIPSSLSPGDYSLSLELADQNSTLANNPAYSMRFANTNIWNSEKGTNYLNHTLTVNEVLGVDDFDSDLSINYYPNPINTELNIENESGKINVIRIHTITGKELFNQSYNNTPLIKINVEDYAKGMYFVTINKETVIKILKK